MIWNHNQWNLTDRGFRNTYIYGTSDGAKWFSLTASLNEIDLPRASGSGSEYAVMIQNTAAHTPIKSVIIAAMLKDGNYGGDCYGLSAVRFVVRHSHKAVNDQTRIPDDALEFKGHHFKCFNDKLTWFFANENARKWAAIWLVFMIPIRNLSY